MTNENTQIERQIADELPLHYRRIVKDTLENLDRIYSDLDEKEFIEQGILNTINQWADRTIYVSNRVAPEDFPSHLCETAYDLRRSFPSMRTDNLASELENMAHIIYSVRSSKSTKANYRAQNPVFQQ